MTKATLRKLLERLRQMPIATPSEALAEFRRFPSDEMAKARKH